MSKPGQYLRHPWTHRSEFQKTKDYGRIDLEECTVHGAKVIAPDSDDELSDSERAVKRRRIEALAEGYLRGRPLLISSARPCPQALRRTVVWHKKSSTEPGFALPEVNTPKESSQVWKDVESDDQILKRLLRPVRSRERHDDALSTRSEPVEAESVEDTRAQASCKPQKRLRTAHISSGPSEEALQKAAALRNRRGRTAGVELTAVVEHRADMVTPASDPADCISVTQSERVLRSQHEKHEWLSRRKSRFSFGGLVVRDVADSASSPCVAPSSMTPASARTRNASSPALKSRGDAHHDRGEDVWLHKNSHHAVPRDDEVLQEPMEAPQFRTYQQRESPLRSIDIAPQDPAAEPSEASHPQASRISVSNASSSRLALDVGTQSAPATRSAATSELMRPTYLQAPSTQTGTTPLMYRKRTTRSKASAPQPDSAPAPTTRRSTRRRVTFPSSEDVPAGGPPHTHGQHVASHPPVLDMSFQPDYSFAPNLNMALVEEHTNKCLPVEPRSEGQVTSTKKALRRELRNSGAEITRCDSEPAPSSQAESAPQLAPQDSVTASSIDSKTGHNLSKPSNSERRQTWLGTQAMVARAERELFASPEKHRGAFTPINEQTPASRYERTTEHTPLSQEREPLKKLSQEPAQQSTQAMLETFGGFSTVKKPRFASMAKNTAEPTPVAMEKGKRPQSTMLAEARRSSLGAGSTSERAKETRGSSLRFSISSFNSPVAAGRRHKEDDQAAQAEDGDGAGSTTTSLATPAASSNNSNSRRSALKSSNPKQPPERHSQGRASEAESRLSQSMSISGDMPTLSFYQAAQRPEASAGLLRDSSNMSQTIDDLTRDVLGTTRDLEGVLSQ